MAAETSAVIALIFIGVLTIGSTTYASFEYSNSLVKNAQYEKDVIKKARMQTDIDIMNMTNSSTVLNLTIKNTGKTTLNASEMSVFINGDLLDFTVVSAGNVWVPQNSTGISIPISVNPGDRIKITTENGVSDYVLR